MSVQLENRFASLVEEQEVIHLPSFTLESGVVLHNVPIAFKTWGRLRPTKDNCLVLCQTFASSANATAWWPTLFGENSNKAFDTSRFFIICLNCLGSPFGSASPCTADPGQGEARKPQRYGHSFPLTTIRDDVR